MKLKKADKVKLVKDLADKVKKENTFLLTNYEGLTSKESNELRVAMVKQGMEYRAVKKSLIQRILDKASLEGLDVLAESGQIALAWSDDGAKLAKTIADFSKKYNKDMIIAGFLEGEFLNKERVVSLSKLPSLEILRAQFVGALKSSMSGLVNVLNGNQRKLVLTLKAISETKS